MSAAQAKHSGQLPGHPLQAATCTEWVHCSGQQRNCQHQGHVLSQLAHHSLRVALQRSRAHLLWDPSMLCLQGVTAVMCAGVVVRLCRHIC